jgi:hypothetical protein
LRLDSGGRDYNGTAYPFEIVGPLVEMSEDVTIGLCLRVEANATIVHDLSVGGKIHGQVVFGIADGIDTRDVLDRAETATMPALDDEGVATADADVDSIMVNEVVTALLAKVKELSARIEALEGNGGV